VDAWWLLELKLPLAALKGGGGGCRFVSSTRGGGKSSLQVHLPSLSVLSGGRITELRLGGIGGGPPFLVVSGAFLVSSGAFLVSFVSFLVSFVSFLVSFVSFLASSGAFLASRLSGLGKGSLN
jgi:hypothetical protein